jgi:hypothetical protein
LERNNKQQKRNFPKGCEREGDNTKYYAHEEKYNDGKYTHVGITKMSP